jgi:hypothetical protein
MGRRTPFLASSGILPEDGPWRPRGRSALAEASNEVTRVKGAYQQRFVLPSRGVLHSILIYLVGEEGFEPTRDVIPADFKSASSAGSDTRPSPRNSTWVSGAVQMMLPACVAQGGWRRRADSNRRMGVLQTPALPLGYVASGWRMEREMGLEPTAFSLARRRSTSELLPHDAICGQC